MNSELGEYIEKVREIVPYNKEIQVKVLSSSKCFIDSQSNNLQNITVPLQLIKKQYFCYCPITSRNGDKLSIAFNNLQKTLQVSGIYIAFRIIRDELLDCEYLNLFFKQAWIDKFARYYSIGTTREQLSWKEFKKLPISVPSMEVQKRIVKKYEYLTKIIQLKKELNEKLEKWMQSLFHVLCDRSEKFTNETFGSLFEIVKGGRPPRSNEYLDRLYFCKEGGIPSLTVSDINRHDTKFVGYVEEYLTEEGFKKSKTQIIKAHNLLFVGGGVNAPQLGKVKINFCNLTTNSTLWALLNKPKRDNFLIPITFSYFLVKENIFKLKNLINSSTDRVSFDLPKFERFEVKLPQQHSIDKFNQICSPIFELQKQNELIIIKCQRLQKCIVETLNW